ncbi:hypothetical protein AGMMS50225_01040 [Betaproteobacteria bacterium]|nr:hypothetical protein AGMMS50225_01040 [Betaproteobacteria bacterium]
MRFEEAYESWNSGRLSQEEAASLLGVSERSFRRYLHRFEAEGMSGLLDRRLEECSMRSAPVDEVLALQEQYRNRYQGWNARHFHSWYKREGGSRSDSWVKTHLQASKELALMGITTVEAANRYLDGRLAIFHGPRKLAEYDREDKRLPLSEAA